MTNTEREELERRYWQLEERIQAIHAGAVVDGDPAHLEGQLLEEQDEIEWTLGIEHCKHRD